MVRKCVAKGCTVNVKNKLPNAHLHSFPTQPDLLAKWLDVWGLVGLKTNWRVCSAHFNKADYVNGLLRFDAIPSPDKKIYEVVVKQNVQSGTVTILLPDSDVVLNLKISRVPSMQKNTITCTVNQGPSTTTRIQAKTVPASVHQHLTTMYENLKRKNRVLLSENRAFSSSKSALSRSLISVEKQSSTNVSMKLKDKHFQELEKINEKLVKSQNTTAKYKAGLDKIFTDKQIQMLVENKKKMNWSNEEIAKSITIRYKSNPYEHLRMNGYPFPSTRTLQRAMQDINFSPGILHAVLNLLKYHFNDASILAKQCILSFDELSIDSTIAYDSNLDKILGPKTNINVYFVRGLFCKWKQPVAYFYDDPFTIENFLAILKAVGDSGLCIQGIVTDLGGKNRGLLNKMQVNVRKQQDSYIIRHQMYNPSFPEVVMNVFADLPHLLKLLRNNMLNHGLKLKGDYWIKKADFERLIEVDKGEFKSSWKLTKAHLNFVGKKKQRVLPAFQTFSKTVAELWRKVFVNRQVEADFIELVNDFCDLLNTRCLTGTTTAKKAFGLDMTPQMKILNDMEDAIVHLRVGEVKHLYPFQRGFLMSIHSLKSLHEQITASPFNQQYILTHKLNQDLIENCFSVIRKIGAYNQNPDPVDAKNRLKLACLGCIDGRMATCPVQSENDGGFLTGDMIRALREHSIDQQVEVDIVLDSERPYVNEFTAETFTEVMENLNIQQQCEIGGQEYVAGYTISKCKEKYPELVASQEELDLVGGTSWVKALSEGNLTVPSITWRNQVEVLYQEFCQFHRGYNNYMINPKAGVLKAFTAALENKYPEIPIEPLRKFVKTIFFIRVRAANRRIKEERSEKLRIAIAQKCLKEQRAMEEEEVYDEDDYDELTAWDYGEELHEPESNRNSVAEDQLMASYQTYLMEERNNNEQN